MFNINEHLAVQFVEFVWGGSHVGHLSFFCLHWITCLEYSHRQRGLILLYFYYTYIEIFPITCILLSVCLSG